jgi:hypothetical protein
MAAVELWAPRRCWVTSISCERLAGKYEAAYDLHMSQGARRMHEIEAQLQRAVG